MHPASPNYVGSLNGEAVLTSRILDSFQIAHHNYLVVLLSEPTQPIAPAEFLALPTAHYTEISRFDVGGQPCAVVKVESEAPAGATDLALLLTERELQVATLVALGRANKQIARQLRISEWTVSTHLRRIFMKLGVDSRAAMVYRCASLIQQLQGQLQDPGPAPLSESLGDSLDSPRDSLGTPLRAIHP